MKNWKKYIELSIIIFSILGASGIGLVNINKMVSNEEFENLKKEIKMIKCELIEYRRISARERLYKSQIVLKESLAEPFAVDHLQRENIELDNEVLKRTLQYEKECVGE